MSVLSTEKMSPKGFCGGAGVAITLWGQGVGAKGMAMGRLLPLGQGDLEGWPCVWKWACE